ncbi:hypothetical protein ATCCBAA256_31020 [Mycobacterium montefiorense]|nr:hypothetical protein ATCCBAA256_31020 [Mycobacterium montefiorense]
MWGSRSVTLQRILARAYAAAICYFLMETVFISIMSRRVGQLPEYTPACGVDGTTWHNSMGDVGYWGWCQLRSPA